MAQTNKKKRLLVIPVSTASLARETMNFELLAIFSAVAIASSINASGFVTLLTKPKKNK